MNREAIEIELEKIDKDLAIIAPILTKPLWAEIETVGVAATIASVYSGYENIFRNLNGGKLIKSESWHSDLLDDAIVKGFVPLEMKRILREMLHFRHVQRNHYIHELTEEKVRQKASELVNLVAPTLNEHLQKFIQD